MYSLTILLDRMAYDRDRRNVPKNLKCYKLIQLGWEPVHVQPLAKRLPGFAVFSSIKTMPLEGKMAPSWWGCLCDVCFASKKPSEWEIFIPARTDLGFKLLSCFKENFLLQF